MKVSTTVYRPGSTRSATAWAKEELKDEADPAYVVASYTSALPGLGDQAVSVLRKPDCNVRAWQHLARAAVSHLSAVGPAGHR
ncbi:hypothetical protein [Streptomyces sp. NPDC004050]